MQTTVTPPQRTIRKRIALLFWIALTLSLLILMMGAPAWAASGANEWQQGTVPMPPPDPGGGGGGSDDDDNNIPAATATPAPPAAPTAVITNALVLTMGIPATETGIVAAPRLNMRAGAGVSFAVVGRVVQSQTVTIQFRNAAGDWWYTCCGTDTTTSGWVSALYVRPTSFDAADANSVLPIAGNVPVPATPSALPVAVAAGDGLSGTVNVTRLNLRAEPSTQGAILGKLLQGNEVSVNARNEDGAWWYICCLANTDGADTSGWVSAAFIAPNFDPADVLTLLPVYEQVSVVLPTPTPRPGAAPAVVPTPEATTTLQLSIVQQPEFVLPGGLLTLHYVITNTGDAQATAVELRNELTPMLALVGGEASTGGLLRQNKTDAGRTVFAVTWPTLASGETLTATVALSVAGDVGVGDVIDNIAAVVAQNAPAQTSGVRVGMPPATLPEFK